MSSYTKITDLLSNVNIDWHLDDYFVASDLNLPEHPTDKVLKINFFGIFVCTSGGFSMSINDNVLNVVPNTLYIINLDSKVRSLEKTEDARLKCLLFTKDFLLRNDFKSITINELLFFSNNPITYLNLSEEESKSFDQFLDLIDKKKLDFQNIYGSEIIKSLIHAFIYEIQSLFHNRSLNLNEKYKREDELHFKFVKLLKDNRSIKQNLRFYADKLFISPNYLIKAIKNASGKTPGELIDEAIIEDAIQFLIYSDYSVNEIAERLRFTDGPTFTKFFKRYTNFSPSAYRKNHKQVNI